MKVTPQRIVDKNAERVTKNLDHLRIERGWDRNQLISVIAPIIGRKFRATADRIRHPKMFSLGEIFALAAYFRKPPEWLFTEHGEG